MRFALAALLFAGSAHAQMDLRAPLAPGIYRFEGKCLEFTEVGIDSLGECRGSLGIEADDPAAPTFMFMTTHGKAWFFYTNSVKSISEDGKVAVYRVHLFLDLDTRGSWKVKGECRLVLHDAKVRVECRAMKGSKSQPMRSGVFESHGTFVYSRGK